MYRPFKKALYVFCVKKHSTENISYSTSDKHALNFGHSLYMYFSTTEMLMSSVPIYVLIRLMLLVSVDMYVKVDVHLLFKLF
jgi:hypothetical protein